MLRSRAFRPSSEKIVHLQLHPTHPWLATADASDNVVVWDWEHRQVVYELNAGGVDTRRLVGAKLQKLADGDSEPKAKITEAIKGGSVKQIKFYDEDVRYWQSWINQSAAAEVAVVNQQPLSVGVPYQATRGRHLLVICCEYKVIFLDMVTMRSRDVPKQMLENKSPLCMEFLTRSKLSTDGPWICFGGSDGVIRVLSIATWQLVRKYVGGHKGSVTCLMTFLSPTAETFLVSGGSDGLLVLWATMNLQETREISPKQNIKAHDGGVSAIELSRVLGGPPQLVTIGADKTLAVWDTVSFKELKRIKPVPKLPCHSIAAWCHPRAPAINILTCVKDSNIWSIQQSSYTAITRPLCDLSSQVPSSLLVPNKKLKCYCMAVHPLQPHLIATGTNYGVILSEFDPKALPSAVAVPTSSGSKEHTAVFLTEKEICLLSFQLSTSFNINAVTSGSVVETVRPRAEPSDASHLQVKQSKRLVAGVPYDVYSCLSVSKSGKYVAVVWPDIPHFTIYKVLDWSIVDSGSAKYFAWDTCKERYALLETTVAPRLPQVTKGRKAKEAALQAATAAAAAASAAASATVQIRIILDDGSANQVTRAIEGRAEPVIGLQGGALLGVAYKFPRHMSFSNAASSAASSLQLALSGSPAFSSIEDSSKADAPANFQLYSWETFKPIGTLLPQPEWTAWDETVEYCAFAYPQYVVISSLRPQYRYVGNVAIVGSTGGVWHRRQLFLATATTIECVFVDAGITAVDLERKKEKEEMKARESQTKSVAEHGELALISVEQTTVQKVQERLSLRPPMLQVVRLASFQHAPTIPPIMVSPRLPKIEANEPKDVEERKATTEVAVAGGGVSVALGRLPQEQKRPVGPVVVVGVRDGVLWLIDRYMTAHAIGLGHPGIRCRCLAAHGDAITAVKWATKLGREHHDDLAQFLLGMGYAAEALHLPGISKRLEFQLALQSNDLKRALQCLLTLSNSRSVGQETDAVTTVTGISILPTIDEKTVDAVQGIIKYAKEFLDLIDAADATAQSQIASQALRRLATAGAIKGALRTQELRGLALRLASHGELTRLGVLVNSMIAAGQGREAALGAALLGDSALLEKAWQETGMYSEAALHAHAHGRPMLKNLLQSWNQILEKESGLLPLKKSETAFSQAKEQISTDDLVLKELTSTNRQPLMEIVPPGNVIAVSTSLSSGKPNAMKTTAAPQSGQPLLLEGPSPAQGLQSRNSLAAASQTSSTSAPVLSPPTDTLLTTPDVQLLATSALPSNAPSTTLPLGGLQEVPTNLLPTTSVSAVPSILSAPQLTVLPPPVAVQPMLTHIQPTASIVQPQMTLAQTSLPLPSVVPSPVPFIPAVTSSVISGVSQLSLSTAQLPVTSNGISSISSNLANTQASVASNGISSLSDTHTISQTKASEIAAPEMGSSSISPLADFLSL